LTLDPEIVRADASEAGQLADLIGGAFAELPPTEWLVPVAAERPRVLADTFRIHVDLAIKHGEVHVTTDRTGVAIWFPRNQPLPEPEDYDSRLAEACGPWTDRFRALDALFEANHPAEPHHHLAFLATRRDTRGQGVGSALLRHHHTYLDENALPAYLEASHPRSRDLYLRHGYELRGEPFEVPSGAPFWPMWRPAQAVASRLHSS
jgi:GNAT superfamily N-acetyltransferase